MSIVLPIRNEEAYIRSCLERLLEQDYPVDLLEILVVDGSSTDGTREVVRSIMREHPDRSIQLLENPKRIVPTALNIGILRARGDVIVRMDGHTVPAQDYVSACVRALRASGAANVGGRIQPRGSTEFGRAVAAAQAHPAGAGDAKFHFATTPEYVDTVYMGAFRKHIFDRAGLFDEAMVRNQDYEMNVRIRKAGERVYLDPSIRSTYTPRGTPRALWRQYFEYGWWRVETLRRHPRSLRWRQLLPAVFVAALVAFSLAAPFTAVGRGLLTLQLIVYTAFLVIATLHARPDLEERRASPWHFPLAIALMHLSWGAGFLLNAASGGRVPAWSHAREP